MGVLVSIDNGGTLTDFCAVTDNAVHHAKAVTTPYDLSKCFFEGLQKLSAQLYGAEDVGRLLSAVDHIRYSTTVGTNALVERKGPRLGILAADGVDLGSLVDEAHHASLFCALVSDRTRIVDTMLDTAAFETAVIKAINDLIAEGSARMVITAGGNDFRALETRIKDVIQRKFPSHLLGAMPLLAAGDLTDDADFVRRTWTALLNSFLHPAMERFLYSADYRLKSQKVSNPLLVFRNDGGSARVAKTTAVKTYSSGPRGGMEGIRALAAHYGFGRVVSYDVGGTTTDIGMVEDGTIRASRRGRCEQVEVSFPLADVLSAGVGGSSIIEADQSGIRVGPRSVGALPGPACFGRGGAKATITDVFLIAGVLDPSSFFGGNLTLDVERAKAAIEQNVARPAGWSLDKALFEMEQAWVSKIAVAIADFIGPVDDAVLAGFGGAGAMAATAIADRLGATRVLIPRLAAVFSAYGINFSDVSQEYQTVLPGHSNADLGAAFERIRERARRDMYAEKADLESCTVTASLIVTRGGEEIEVALDPARPSMPPDLAEWDEVTLWVRVAKPVRRATIADAGHAASHVAAQTATRTITVAGKTVDVPVYRVEALLPGATAAGPAIIEEAYFTGKVDVGWRFEITASGDILLTKTN